MHSLTGTIINFRGFYKDISDAIDLNSIFAVKLIKEKDKPHLYPEVINWLLKRTNMIGIQGYIKQGYLQTFFDKDVMEEFDQLYLDFRDYLRDEKGIDPNKPLTLLRHGDYHSFIPLEGEPDDQVSHSQHFYVDKDLPEVGDESDPFLPNGRWVYTTSE